MGLDLLLTGSTLRTQTSVSETSNLCHFSTNCARGGDAACVIILRTLHTTGVDREDHLNEKDYRSSYFGTV